jgi:hypothetical protein
MRNVSALMFWWKFRCWPGSTQPFSSYLLVAIRLHTSTPPLPLLSIEYRFVLETAFIQVPTATVRCPPPIAGAVKAGVVAGVARLAVGLPTASGGRAA